MLDLNTCTILIQINLHLVSLWLRCFPSYVSFQSWAGFSLIHQMTTIYIFYSSVSTDEMLHTTRLTSKVHHYYRHLPIWVCFLIFLGLSITQSQLPECSTDCLPLLVNHLFLVLPILQIISSPSRQQQTFSPWLSSSEPMGHVALQILRHVEVHVLPLVKQQESVVSTCIDRLSGCPSSVNLHERITWSSRNAD